MGQEKTLMETALTGAALLKKGKVREVYDLGEELLFVASDRISAFDVVMANGIPDKGKVLNNISAFWFEYTKDIVENHMITIDIDEIVSKYPALADEADALGGRSMLVKRTEPVMVECIVRGYLSGSGWRDYQNTGEVSGVKLPEGLSMCDKLDEPIFTPSTKAETGHDVNITQKETISQLGEETFGFLKDKSLELYRKAAEYAEGKGIIIADTKFEFGMVDGKIILIDEALTPDSSRFWPMDEYQSGRSQKSFDKQFVRDYLETIDWDKTPPGPELPEEIVDRTRSKYLQSYSILTGREL